MAQPKLSPWSKNDQLNDHRPTPCAFDRLASSATPFYVTDSVLWEKISLPKQLAR
ncbi:hypothetical protein RRSWK_05941 [Rhodopirellula sp. SWK7]|nr:hypothetical protein RRSWK_05941 [Rhodopirellula sp. SWK7]